MCVFAGRLFALLLLLPLPVMADGQSPATSISIPRVTTSTVTPWGILNADHSLSGILVDFQNTLFARAGLSFSNRAEPYPRVIQSIASGDADVAVMFVSPMSERIGLSLGKVLDERIVIVTLANAAAVNSLDDFSGKLVGHVRGSKYGDAFDLHPGIVRTAVTDVDQGLKMLLSGRLAAMASTEHSLLYAMYMSGIDSRRIRIALPLFTVRVDLYVSRQAADEPWVTRLRQTMASMTEDGSLKSALYQHSYWPYSSFCFAGGQCLNSYPR